MYAFVGHRQHPSGIRYAWRRLLQGIGFVMLATLATAKELPQYGVRHYDRLDGLSASTILEVAQTRDGYLWVGTYDGLNRFNGVEFQVFSRANTPGLKSDNITSICQTQDGVLWIGTLGKGVVGFTDSSLKQTKKGSELPEEVVNDLIEDAQGRLYAATRSGLYCYDASGQWKTIDASGVLEGISIEQLALDEKDRLLMATGRGIFRREGSQIALLDPAIPTDIQIQGFVYHPETGLWFGTFRSGLFHYSEGRLEHFTTENGLSSNAIGDLVFDADGNLWIGGWEGISRYEHGNFSHYRIKGQMVFAMYADLEGGMWVGTYLQGLFRFGDTRFSSFSKNEDYDESIVGRAVIELEGRLVVGANMGIFKIKNGHLDKDANFDELDEVMIRTLKPASDGGVWVASHTNGIAKMYPDGSVMKWGLEQGLSSVTNRCVLETRDGTVWIAGDKGLQWMKDGKIQNFAAIQGLPVLSLHELHDGALFVAMDGDGFYIIRGESLTHFTKKDGLSSDIVFFALEDESGDLWITMSDGGIAYFHEDSIHLLTDEDGLPRDSIFYLIDDGRGSYWMACNSGIYSINKAELHARAKGGTLIPHSNQYDKSDGITSGGVTSVTHPYLDAAGELWFPTTQGLVSVNPDSLSLQAKAPPKARIESFATETHDYSIHESAPVRIPPDTKRFTFTYAALSFDSAENARYRVMMEGFDKEFTEIGNRMEYSYTNLPPGHYTFRVNAANREGPWSEASDAISFVLEPYFYQTPLFLISSILGGLFFISVLIWRRTTQSRRRERLLQQMVEQRTADLKQASLDAEQANQSKGYFLASISHEVRNPMNGIVGITELLLSSDLTEDQRKYLHIVRNSSQSLLTILNDLLDYSKIDSNRLQLEHIPFSIQSMIEETLGLQEQHIREKSLTVSISIDPDLPDTVIGDPLRHRQVLNNLISNAIKFTEKGSVTISVQLEKADAHQLRVKFSVKDTGIGISETARQRLFKAYEQGETSVARTHGGTGLGLAICRSLVELMGGEIWVQSTLGHGSDFQFTSILERPAADSC